MVFEHIRTATGRVHARAWAQLAASPLGVTPAERGVLRHELGDGVLLRIPLLPPDPLVEARLHAVAAGAFRRRGQRKAGFDARKGTIPNLLKIHWPPTIIWSFRQFR